MEKRAYKNGFREVMKHSPVCVQKFLTSAKIRRLREHLMTEADLLACENNTEACAKIVNIYKKRYPRENKKLQENMKDVFEHNPRIRTGFQREEMKADMEFCWFAYGFRPDEYMFLDLGGGNKSVDKRRSFVSDRERAAFRFSVNNFTEWILSDKAEVYKRFGEYYKRDALCIDRQTKYEDFQHFINKHPSFVQKYVSSTKGAAVRLKNRDKIGNPKEYFKKLKSQGKYLLEERIEQSNELNAFSTSVNNIRVSTFYTRDGIELICGFFTLGQKGTFVVNATIGCVFAAIDVKSGKICSEGCDEFGNRYETHPDSGITIKGYQLPDWDEAKEICLKIAAKMPQIKYVSFDLAHTTKGWVIIEINPSGQLLHQAGTLTGFKPELKSIIDRMDTIVPFSI